MSGGSSRGSPSPHPPGEKGSPHLHDALDVAVPLGEVHGAQTRGALAVLHVRAEHRAGALSLPTDDTAHGGLRAAHDQRPSGPGTPATPPSESQHPPSRSQTLRASTPGSAPQLSLGSPARVPSGPKAADGGGWRQGRLTTHTSYLLRSVAGRGDAAQESRLIFRGGAEIRLSFRRGVSPVHAGTRIPPAGGRGPGASAQAHWDDESRGAQLSGCQVGTRPGRPPRGYRVGSARGRLEGSRDLTEVSQGSIAP